METRSTVLKTKLRIPESPGSIERKHLLSAFADISQKKIAVVVAGAGYGKTTLVAQAVKTTDLPTVWYSLDETDVDLSVFMTYLIAGVRQYYPDFGQHLLDQTGIISSSSRSRKDFLINLLQEMENISAKDLVIVLDDYYTVEGNPDISASLSFLLNKLPPSIHFVIISRIEPGIQLSRLRAMSEVIDISENDLGFSSDEIKTLYCKTLNLPLSETHLQKIRERTDGWAAGLIMFYHSIKGLKVNEIDFTLDRLQRLNKTLKSYFEETVFRKLNPEIQDFMLNTSILPSMTADFCDRYLGIDDSAAILTTLEESHLFTFCSREEQVCYSYHHLLKDFLEQKLKQQTGRKNLEKLHCLAGDLLREDEYFTDALLHYLEGNDYEKACELFLELDLQLFMVGRLNLIQRFYRQIPETRINRDPQLQLLKARLWSLSGKPNDAIRSLKSGLKMINRTNNEESVPWFQKELGMQYYYSGDIPGAISQFRDVLNLDGSDPQLSAEAAGMLSFLLSVQGKISEADKMLATTQDFVERIDGDLKPAINSWVHMYRSFRYYSSGDFIKSKLFALDGLQIIEKLNIAALLPLGYLQLSYADTSLGNHEAAAKTANRGIKIAVKMGINDSFLAWLYTVVGQANLSLGCIDDALQASQTALELFRNIGNKWGMGTAHDLLCRSYLHENRDQEVEHHLELGYEAIKGQLLPLTRGLLDGARILLLIRNDRIESALEQIRDTLTQTRSVKHLTCLLLLQQAGLYLRMNNHPSAIQSLQEGLRIAEKNRYLNPIPYDLQPVWTQLLTLRSHEKIKPLWNKVLGNGKLDKVGLPGSESVNTRPSAGFPELRIECFGQFKVFKGGREILVESWKSSKTEQLFKYLIAKHDRGYVSRDLLIEVLWPNEPATKCLKRLNVAFTTLRNFLEPGRKPGEDSNYLLRQKDAYRIDLGVNGTTDVLEFLQAVKAGEDVSQQHSGDPEAGMESYFKAESIRKGEFLESDPYPSWCSEERERLNQAYLSVLNRIIDYYESKNDFQQGLLYAQKALNIDPYAEHIYRKMMLLHAGSGNNPMVLKTFEKCRLSLEKELNCPLSRETIALFNHLTQSDRSN